MFKELEKATFREVPEALVALTRRVVGEVLNLDDYRGRRGRKGNVGDQGPAGERGAEGKVGRPGMDGIDGAIGAEGPDGDQGERGKRGYKGLVGRQGEVGSPGPPGPRGVPGPIPRHKWEGTRLAFEGPDGKFNKSVELKGPGGGRGGASVKDTYGSISLNGTSLEFKKLGAMGPDTTVDLSSLAGGGEVSQAQRVDEVGNVMYIGTAVPGTIESAALWAIKRLTFITTGSDTDIDTEWANGAAVADRVWDDRLTESYS